MDQHVIVCLEVDNQEFTSTPLCLVFSVLTEPPQVCPHKLLQLLYHYYNYFFLRHFHWISMEL